MEPEWAMFRASIVEAAARSCDKKAVGACHGGNPRTRWWTPAGRKPSDPWAWLAQGSPETADEYRKARRAAVYWSVVVKRELSWKAKLSIYRSIYVTILTYGHKLCVVTEIMRSRIQASEMSFLRRVAGLSLRDRVRSSDFRRDSE